MMSPYVLAAAGVLIIIVFLCVVKNRRSGKPLPPSPPSSLPLIGHLHLIGSITHRSLHGLYLRYGGGGGLLLLQLGRRRTLVVSTAAAAADLFRNHDLAFASRPRSVAADRLMYGCRNVSFAPYGEDWRRGKKAAVVHLLSPRRVASFAPVRAAEAAALVARARRAAEAREAVELRELLYGYTNAVVTRAATGAAGATVERLKQLIGSTAPLVAGLQPEDVLPDAPARFVRWATGLDKMLDDRAEAWDRFLSEILAAHQEKGAGSAGEEEEDEDFLDVLLRLRREGADGLEFTDDRIKAMVKDMIAAGTGISSETLQWTMAELVANPRVMAKLQDEIARAAAAAADEAAITEADLSKMELEQEARQCRAS
ncbi:hypothetical protein PVAP13_6KG140660 [Panicum virgatum]|uniref:Uncharacterized protein n=2 Tax=Panicum virgatum TaxID=38727 RepID=A0A8T0RBY6_PANVG|nr:hypothetical protein PVAP13_6KG140660 [Panicum virgatum]